MRQYWEYYYSALECARTKVHSLLTHTLTMLSKSVSLTWSKNDQAQNKQQLNVLPETRGWVTFHQPTMSNNIKINNLIIRTTFLFLQKNKASKHLRRIRFSPFRIWMYLNIRGELKCSWNDTSCFFRRIAFCILSFRVVSVIRLIKCVGDE